MNPHINPEYWMRMAVDVAKASTCRANVGCVLVHKNTIVGIGYVGSIHGDHHCNSTEGLLAHKTDHHILMPSKSQGSTKKGNTCIRTVHAEMNAILKCTVRGSYQNGWIQSYSTYQPCLNCTKVLLQIGVRQLYYLKEYKDIWRDKFWDKLDRFEFHDCQSVNRLMMKQVNVI